ncbi:MAG: alpha/beta fold hydrolase, partial [Planctomycetota bacterium]
MRKIISECLILALCCCSTIAWGQSDDLQQYSIEQFLKTTSYNGGSFSPDNSKLLINSDETGVFNAYAVNIADGTKTQLTKSEVDSVFAIDYFPEDERFLYTADQGGNELNHVYVQSADGTTKDLTPGDKLKAQFAGWAHDRKSFYIQTNERDPKFFDVYEYQLGDFSREMIFKNEQGFFPGPISRDGKWLALAKIDTRDNSDIFLFNRTDKSIACITDHDGNINHSAVTFTPDSKSLIFATDKDSEFRYLMKRELASGDTSPVAKVEWDISNAFFSHGGKYFGYSFNEDGKTQYRVFDHATNTPIKLPEIEGGSIGGLTMSDDEQHVKMYASSGRMPSDLFYYNWTDAQPKQLTRSLNAEINPDHLVNGKVVRFKSFDGTEIPGILYTPQNASPENKRPALVWVHGGPGGQSRLGYRALIQYLVNHGYVIYAINNRGSSGYGKTFQQMDDQKHGEGDLDDCVQSKQMLINTGVVDPDRIGIIGGSYGGYMVCAALAFRPEEFEVGVDIFGVTNWHRTVQSIPPWWEAQRKALEKELGDFDNLDYFKKISPLFHADKIVKPLMVLQGANDPRVLKVESDEMVEAVKKNGVPVEYIVFDDEGHGFRKKKNQHRGYKAILEFCD